LEKIAGFSVLLGVDFFGFWFLNVVCFDATWLFIFVIFFCDLFFYCEDVFFFVLIFFVFSVLEKKKTIFIDSGFDYRYFNVCSHFYFIFLRFSALLCFFFFSFFFFFFFFFSSFLIFSIFLLFFRCFRPFFVHFR
jgi:hypothetical protein